MEDSMKVEKKKKRKLLGAEIIPLIMDIFLNFLYCYFLFSEKPLNYHQLTERSVYEKNTYQQFQIILDKVSFSMSITILSLNLSIPHKISHKKTTLLLC